MELEIIKYVAPQGVFALLFCWLLFSTRKESAEREKGYQETIKENQQIISKLADKMGAIEYIKEDIKEIKEKLR